MKNWRVAAVVIVVLVAGVAVSLVRFGPKFFPGQFHAVSAQISKFKLPDFGISFGVNGGICKSDNEVDKATREAANAVALDFARKVLAQKAEDAYPATTADLKAKYSKEAFAATLNQFVAATGEFSPPAPEHIYLIQSAGSGPEIRTVCGGLSGDSWVSLSAKPGYRQAHVLMSSKTRNNDWAITEWLLQEGVSWHVQYFNIGMSGTAGNDLPKMLELARREKKAGHDFNATMLYVGVRALTDRGPQFQLGIAQTIDSELQSFTPAKELQGNSPYAWTMRGHTYSVEQVTILGIDGKLGLVFVLPQKSWPGDKEIDAASRVFLDDFRAVHPEYKDVFGFLVVRAMKADKSGGFGTVYENGKGY